VRYAASVFGFFVSFGDFTLKIEDHVREHTQSEIFNLKSKSAILIYPVLCRPAAIPLMVAPSGYSNSEVCSPCCLRLKSST